VDELKAKVSATINKATFASCRNDKAPASRLSRHVTECRYTRVSNAFSNRFENHCYALVLYFFHYN